MLSQMLGPWLYALVFVIVFCETGLVVTPFLPGDSLLFALGSLTSLPGAQVNMLILSLGFILATFAGDNLNYYIGKKFGPRVFQNTSAKFFNPDHLRRTHEFYERHGKKAVVLARFIPIVRTFVPFVAGIAQMPYGQYLAFSVIGSLLWTQSFLWAGNIFGEMEFIKQNFQIVILAVIFISVLPGLITWYRSKSQQV